MRFGHLGSAVVLILTTACHGECYVLRTVESSGTFGDTLVAVSGSGVEPGTVSLQLTEQEYSSSEHRYGSIALNATGVVDSATLYRLTLVSDASRQPVLTATTKFFSSVDTTAFNTLWVRLATEDVLFEVVGRNGSVGKALLNLENRTGPREACEPWT